MRLREIMSDTERDLACGKGGRDKVQVQTIRDILASGLHVDAADGNGNTMLMFAAQAGAVEVLQYLLDHEASVNQADVRGQTALFRAVGMGRLRAAEVLMAHGASFGKIPADAMVSMAHLIELVAKDGDDEWCAELMQSSRILLDAGARPLDRALIHCARHGLYDLAELLLERGANPSYIWIYGDAETHAAARGDTRMVELIRRFRRSS